ncbi:hypothetical protein [Kribbella sp. CA-294648]|uniref:hypothetical protein n=1 Tax=Kribbella sp. CA-294648 TaxID=3239948 RepID=UPI003D8F71DF
MTRLARQLQVGRLIGWPIAMVDLLAGLTASGTKLTASSTKLTASGTKLARSSTGLAGRAEDAIVGPAPGRSRG